MNEWRFDRESIRTFRFVRAEFDATSGVARLVYAFDDGPELVETITFPGAPFVLDDARSEAAQRALRLLHGIAGVSYYKAAVPPQIVIEGEGIDADTAALLTEIYENGLGEFAYRNGLDLLGRIRFPRSDSPPPQPSPASGGGSQASHPEPLLPPLAGEGWDGGVSVPQRPAEGAQRSLNSLLRLRGVKRRACEL